MEDTTLYSGWLESDGVFGEQTGIDLNAIWNPSDGHLVPRWGPSSRFEQILPAWSKQRCGLAGDLEGLVQNDGEKATTDLEAARDVNSTTCDFVDYWRATELWRTATSWTSGPGGHDSQKRR
jgi:hypothetical protein